MTNYSIEKIKLAASQHDDQQLIETLTALAIKDELKEDDLTVKACLHAVLEERHGRSEAEHIERLIKKKSAA
jgi:hypothetical protein